MSKKLGQVGVGQVVLASFILSLSLFAGSNFPWHALNEAEVDSSANNNSTAQLIGAIYHDFITQGIDVRTASPHSLFPLVISPTRGSDSSAQAAITWLETNKEWWNKKYLEHGALLFRGFDITSASTFEKLADAAVAPDRLFDGIYLGTSPRLSAVDGTRAVYTASEIPGWQAVPVHLEMSFKKKGLPDRILFWAQTPNQSEGGETPLADFQQVWDEMKPDIKQRFRDKGVRYVRHYFSDQNGGRKSVFPWTMQGAFSKSWEAMFHTNNKTAAEQAANSQGFDVDWVQGEADLMRLSHSMNVTRVHPATGAFVWSNHFAVIHSSGASDDYAWHAFSRPDSSLFWRLQMLASYAYVKVFRYFATLAIGLDGVGMNTLYADGTPIPDKDWQHVRQLIWRNSLVAPWQSGDVALLDNNRIAHGRSPFSGKRRVLTTWTEKE